MDKFDPNQPLITSPVEYPTSKLWERRKVLVAQLDVIMKQLDPLDDELEARGAF